MKNKIVSMVVAVLLLAICIVPLLFSKVKKTERYDAVVFGDSIVAGLYSHDSVAVQLERMSGMRTLTGAFGGTTMADTNINGFPGDHYSFFSMARLSEAVKNRDFSKQVMSAEPGNNNILIHYPYYAGLLNTVDWKNVKYIIIEHGANDYSMGIKVDNPADKYDVTTFGGALRQSILNIREGVPNAEIILLTPLYNHIEESGDCFEMDYGGGILSEYVSKEIEIADEMGVKVVDNFHESGIGPDNYTEYLLDGLHCNDAASTIMANKLWLLIQSMIDNDEVKNGKS